MKKMLQFANMMRILLDNKIDFDQVTKISDNIIIFYNIKRMTTNEYKFNVYSVTKNADLFFLIAGTIHNDDKITIDKKNADTLYIKYKKDLANKVVDKRIEYIENRFCDDILNKFKIKLLNK